LFSKGSPEIIKTLLNPQSFDLSAYDENLKNYSSKGFRILAIASKKINFDLKKERS
jgi:magnesium-transporting ATPase (P-type)